MSYPKYFKCNRCGHIYTLVDKNDISFLSKTGCGCGKQRPPSNLIRVYCDYDRAMKGLSQTVSQS